MGCGKTTIGKALAGTLNTPFIDLDQYIEAQENRTINDIFENKGEMYFRKLERDALIQVINQQPPKVIALGGGTPCYYDNINRLVSSSHASFYLKASISTLSTRLWEEKHHRPMLHRLESQEALSEFIAKHLFERSFFYHQAKKNIPIDGKSVASIVREIKRELS